MNYAVAAVIGILLSGCGSSDADKKIEPRNVASPYPATGVTREFTFTITENVAWEVGPGAIYDALAYNGQIPGPMIDVNAGDRVLIHLTNQASKPHSIHTHVVEFDYANDGVDA